MAVSWKSSSSGTTESPDVPFPVDPRGRFPLDIARVASYGAEIKAREEPTRPERLGRDSKDTRDSRDKKKSDVGTFQFLLSLLSLLSLLRVSAA
jgi:hypothetical protein